MRRSALAAAVMAVAITIPFPLSQPETRLPEFVQTEVIQTDEVVGHEMPAADAAPKDQARLEDQAKLEPNCLPYEDCAVDPMPPRQDLSYLAYYAYSEVPPNKKPADTILDYLISLPIGTAIEEIKHASDAFGLDLNFMKAVAKIESDFGPTQRTGSYIGLFQLSNYEFRRYGSGYITNPRDNAIAAAYKFVTAAILFELDTHKKPTLYDLYLIHQQGWQGAAQHVAHPERIAWQSMCATDEGHEKGEKWCKRAIWANTLPDIKKIWKSVDNLTSGAFVEMWQRRIDLFYTRYSEATAKN
ncbi:MAG: transglycosylase [Xanthobacteraceae bacterium]